MTKRVLICMMAGAGLLFAGHASAELKIGFVHVPEVMDNMPEAAAIREKISEEFSGKERELRSKQQELVELHERYERDSAVMSGSEVERMETQMRSLQQELQRGQQQLQQEANQRGQEEMQRLNQRIGEVVDSIARSEGYDLILVDGVAHVTDKINITDQVIRKLTEGD